MHSSTFVAAFLLVFIFGIQNVDTRYVPNLKRFASIFLASILGFFVVQWAGFKDSKLVLPKGFWIQSDELSNDASMPDIYRRKLFKHPSMPANLEHHRYRRDLRMGIDPNRFHRPEYEEHTISGRIYCYSTKANDMLPIGPDPTVKFMFYDQELGSSKIDYSNNEYTVSGLIYDEWLYTGRLRLVFENICRKGDHFESHKPKSGKISIIEFDQ